MMATMMTKVKMMSKNQVGLFPHQFHLLLNYKVSANLIKYEN